MLSVNILMMDIFLLFFPVFLMLSYLAGDYDDLKENKFLYHFIQAFILVGLVVYGFQIVHSVYFTLDGFFFIPAIFFGISLLILIRLRYENELDKRIYYLNFILILILILFGVAQPFIEIQTKDLSIPEIKSIVPIVMIILLLSTILSFAILIMIRKYYNQKALRETIDIRELKIITGVFLILIGIFSTISFVSFFLTFPPAIIFSGIEIGDVGESIDLILLTITSDGLFVFTVVMTGMASVVTAIGSRQAVMFGNMFMTFMPMIMFIRYAFGGVPVEIVSLFGDFEWLGRVFYIVLTLMMMAMFLSAWKLIAGITQTQFRI